MNRVAWWLIHDIDRWLRIALDDPRLGCDTLAEQGTQWSQVVIPMVSEMRNKQIDASSGVNRALAMATNPCVRFNNLPKFIDRSNASQLGFLDYRTVERRPDVRLKVA
jgi:hypothetical protein